MYQYDPTLYREKYRIQSTRLPDRDYSADGYYFVTICVKDRECVFGDIKNGIMGLNELGCMAAQCWQEISKHFENVILDQWVVMPNHLHGVIQIYNAPSYPCRDAINRVSTNGNTGGGITGSHNPIGKKTLGEIIRQFKARVTRQTRQNGYPDFQWQSRFYDHIIRNEKSLNKIRQYIWDNSWKWE